MRCPYTLLCALSRDAHLQPLLIDFFCTTYSLNQMLKSKKKEPHLGREWCKEGLPRFTRTNHNYRSDLGLRLISYINTPLARYQGRETALLERNRPQKQSSHGSPKDNPKCPLQMGDHIFLLLLDRRANDIIKAYIASQSPWREGKVVLHISIKQLVLTEQTIIQHSTQKSN